MRAFLAIEIEDFIKDNIDKTQNIIRNQECANINFVKSQNIHLTLKFFGDIDQNQQKQISNIVKECVEEYEEYELKLVNIGAFRNIYNPRVIWIGIKDKNKTTINIIKKLDEEFNKIGFKKEKDYVPHITIGRVKNISDKDKLTNIIKDMKKDYFGKMRVKQICLKSSKLTPNGPIYNTEEKFILGDK